MSATAFCKDLYNTIERVNEDCAPVHITTTRGKGAVLVGEDDWASIEETLYLEDVEWQECGTSSLADRR
ncbi:MAG TPA: type II toxin-antitoxin system Phd/YefM family antitoxin [Collinsella ihuae]|uniref:Antitoxin n=1 Tax=Collinsella ihumii TaxID=1720204 RepID=A0A921IR00_9ACTN|nr:type II toxin-antitoxin system Phd/YefM family antitoxin [Collinsella ihumii]